MMITLDEALENVSVIGAAGKMGKGIALVLLKELLQLNKASLQLIDPDPSRLNELENYLNVQLSKKADKEGLDKEVLLKKAKKTLQFSTELSAVKHSKLIFEAIPEDLSLKKTIFNQINKICLTSPYFLSNTSSIPISVLNNECNLKNRIIGFHFYNPPPIQKLVEIIPSAKTAPELTRLSLELGTRLKKTLVQSEDIAGFIGNGHFLREIVYSCEVVDRLEAEYGFYQAIYMLNYVTEQFLIRPMGIFQLIDYVGLDICEQIGTVMETYIPNQFFRHKLIKRLLKMAIRGGQKGDGSQSNGIFKYSKGPDAVIDEQGSYHSLKGSWLHHCHAVLGELPPSHQTWKNLVKESHREDMLLNYFSELKQQNSLGAKLAIEFSTHSQKIAKQLLLDTVAHKAEDINTVLTNGFYHLYGPINPFINGS
jgi:3-hydroxyacyl-CoA dehydrogenase